MKIVDLYLDYLDEQYPQQVQQPQPSVGDRVAGGLARGIGKAQGLLGKGLMFANLANFSSLPPLSQALMGTAAGGMALNAYQNWKAKRAAAAAAKARQQQMPQQQ